MSFLKNSLNYSLSTCLKTKYLNKALQIYNNFLFEHNSLSQTVISPDNTDKIIYIPNNNAKFYLYIVPKKVLENNKHEQYSILYFFSPENPNDDFFIESNLFSSEAKHTFFLFEGYLYTELDKKEYLITDYLLSNNQVINYNYSIRQELLLNLQPMFDGVLNDSLKIKMHYIVNDPNLLDIFKENFYYKNSLCAIEEVSKDFVKSRYLEIVKNDIKEMLIIKSNITEIYNVFDPSTNNEIGVLYIKSLMISKKMKALFLKNEKMILSCSFNKVFNKWQPIL
jgi:hypothetical protein